MIFATGPTGPAAACGMPWEPSPIIGEIPAVYVPPARRKPEHANAVRQAEASLAELPRRGRPKIGNSPAEVSAVIRFIVHRTHGGQMSFEDWYRDHLRDGGVPQGPRQTR